MHGSKILRTTVTKHMTALEALLQNPAAPTLALNTHLSIIVEKQLALDELDNQIHASLTDDVFDDDVLTAIEQDESICALRTRVRSVTSPASSATANAVRSDESSGSAITQAPPGPPHATLGTRFATLPKLRIPTFSGNRRDWQGFWNQYDASIHSNQALPRVEKFRYLLSYLTGPAKDAIDGIRLADDNYDCAITEIMQRKEREYQASSCYDAK